MVAQDRTLFLWLCTGGQEPFRICFSSFGACLPMASKGRPASQHEHACNDPLALWMALLALQWRSMDRQKERRKQQSKASWESDWRGSSRLCMIDAAISQRSKPKGTPNRTIDLASSRRIFFSVHGYLSSFTTIYISLPAKSWTLSDLLITNAILN